MARTVRQKVSGHVRAARKAAFGSLLRAHGLRSAEAAEILSLNVRTVNRYLDPDDAASPREVYLEKLGVETKRPANGAAREPVALVVKSFDITAGAGSMGGLVISEREIGSYSLDEFEMRDLFGDSSPPVAPFSFRMIGESMEPEFRDGDRLLIESYPPGTQTVLASGIYVFRLDDSIEVKQLERGPRRRLFVSAFNPRYRSYELSLDEDHDFEIIGRVRGRFKRY